MLWLTRGRPQGLSSHITSNMYIIETRTVAGWLQLMPETFDTLKDASLFLERHIDNMFFEFKMTLPTNIFRFRKQGDEYDNLRQTS